MCRGGIGPNASPHGILLSARLSLYFGYQSWKLAYAGSDEKDTGGHYVNVREYLSVRRAFGLARQEMPASERITFEELGILCHLALAPEGLRTSEIAEYQGVLRPTMTHRTSHLATLGLIERSSGQDDRRSICCTLSGHGADELGRIVPLVCDKISSGMPMSRCTPQRMRYVLDAMGRLSLSSSDLVLLGVWTGMCGREGTSTVGELVDGLGLLQPTVSMAVSSREHAGDVVRTRTRSGKLVSAGVRLSDQGEAHATRLDEHVSAVRVARPRRSKK